MVDLNAEKGKLHDTLMAELMKEDASSKSIDKIAKSINTNRGKALSLKMDYLLKVKKVLPPDHFKAFITKGHKGQSCAPGCKKPCCATKSTGCKGASKCPMAGTEGHKCTDACKTGSHCKTPCKVEVKK